jgi:hypothetical protein
MRSETAAATAAVAVTAVTATVAAVPADHLGALKHNSPNKVARRQERAVETR